MTRAPHDPQSGPSRAPAPPPGGPARPSDVIVGASVGGFLAALAGVAIGILYALARIIVVIISAAAGEWLGGPPATLLVLILCGLALGAIEAIRNPTWTRRITR